MLVLGFSAPVFADPTPGAEPNATPTPTADPADATYNEPIGSQVYLYYYDNPVRLVEAITGKAATEEGAELKGLSGQSSSMADIVNARAQRDVETSLRARYENERRPFENRKSSLSLQRKVLLSQIKSAGVKEQSLEMEKEIASLRSEADPDNSVLLEAKKQTSLRLSEYKAGKVGLDQQSLALKNQEDEVNGELKALDEKYKLLSDFPDPTLSSELPVNPIPKKEAEFISTEEKRNLEFAATRDNQKIFKCTFDSVTFVAIPQQKSIYMYGPSEKIHSYRGLIQTLDRPMPQATVHLWTLQFSSTSDAYGSQQTNQALEHIEEVLKHTRAQSLALSECFFSAFAEVTGTSPQSSPPGSGAVDRDFWRRVSLYDRSVLKILLAVDDPSPVASRSWSVDQLEKTFPLARLCVPDPARVTNLSELLTCASMLEPVSRANFANLLQAKLRERNFVDPFPDPEVQAKELAGGAPLLTNRIERLLETIGIATINASTSPPGARAVDGAPFRVDVALGLKDSSDRLLMNLMEQRLEHLKYIDYLQDEEEEAAQVQTAASKKKVNEARVAIKDAYTAISLNRAILKRKPLDLEAMARLIAAEGVIHKNQVDFPQFFIKKKPESNKSPGDEEMPEIENLSRSRYVYYYSEVEPLRIELRRRLTLNDLSNLEGGYNQLGLKLALKLPSFKDQPAHDFRRLKCAADCFTFSENSNVKHIMKQVSDLRRVLSTNGFGASREAATNMRLRKMMGILDDAVSHYTTSKCLRTLTAELSEMGGIQVGTIERTSLLCSSRLESVVDARASARLEIGERQDIFEQAQMLALLAGSPNGGQALDMLQNLNEQKVDSAKQLYAINTGGFYQFNPIVDPTGQGLRLRFNHVAKNIIADPNGSSRPQMNRIENHSVNTEVVMSNFEMREISRYLANAKLGIPEKRWGGIPILKELPGLREVPLIGWFSREYGEAPVQQYSMMLADSVVCPTVDSLVESLGSPLRGVLDFPEKYYEEGPGRILPDYKPAVQPPKAQNPTAQTKKSR